MRFAGKVAVVTGGSAGLGAAIALRFNNAAIASTLSLKPFDELTTEEFRNVLAVNTIGTFHGCKAVAALMRQQDGGRIINMDGGAVYH